MGSPSTHHKSIYPPAAEASILRNGNTSPEIAPSIYEPLEDEGVIDLPPFELRGPNHDVQATESEGRCADKPKTLNLGNFILGNKIRKKQKHVAARLHDQNTPASPDRVTRRQDSMELDCIVAPTPSTTGVTPPPRPRPHSVDGDAESVHTARAEFERKKRAGTLSISEEMEFMRLEAREEARRRRERAEEGGDLFISSATSPASHPAFFRSSYAAGDAGESTRRPSTATGKRVRDDIGDGGEDGEDGEDGEVTGQRLDSSGKLRKRSGAYDDEDVDRVLEKGQGRQNGNGREKHVKRKSKGKDPAHQGRTREAASLTSIYGSNVFKDAQKNADKPEQPTFNVRRKGDALKQLIASVPAENRKIASADKKFLDAATRDFDGFGACYPSNDGSGNWHLRGMKSTLMHYQVLGAAFMRRREREAVEPRGGILADEMGLGKTVMMLANVVNGKPRPGSTAKCTLVVAGPALCDQWDAEIAKHCKTRREDRRHGIGGWVQHRAQHRISADDGYAAERIAESDICLTTYSEIARSYPKGVAPLHLTTARQKEEWWQQHYEQHRGIFHRIHFHRVVLDEAQAIKNHKAHTSIACRAIRADHHWAISGTPIMNRLSEFYPYFKFIREPHADSFKTFKENFCSPDDPDGTGKLAVLLSKLMVRRTHVDTLFGARLLDLPPPRQHVVWLRFNKTERAIYEIVKNRFAQRIHAIAKRDGGVAHHYSHIWTMLLRLRQLCAHVLLIQGTICDLLEREDFEKLNRLARNTGHADDGAAVLVHLRNVLATRVSGDETGPIDAPAGGEHVNRGDRDGEEAMQRSVCCACRQLPDQPYLTSCSHIYCQTCVRDLQHHAARRGRDAATCVECGAAYTHVSPGPVGAAARPPPSPVATPSSPARDGTRAGTPRPRKPDDEHGWIELAGEVLPSTKTVAITAQIHEWLREDPQVKIIVYTQFLPVVRILARVCGAERWGHARYTGAMSLEARGQAVRAFAQQPDIHILLASVHCGGLGLNLTMASRVVLVDPWWNSAAEQQAFCRVFRVGQHRATRMTRFVVEDSVEAAMMAIKDRKQRHIDALMHNPSLVAPLHLDDLLLLFAAPPRPARHLLPTPTTIGPPMTRERGEA